MYPAAEDRQRVSQNSLNNKFEKNNCFIIIALKEIPLNLPETWKKYLA